MGQWYGTSRTNYVRIIDEAKLKEVLDRTGLTVERSGPRVAFFPNDMRDDGGWPSYYEDDSGEEHEFGFDVDVMPIVAEGEVLVCMSAGAEKSRYVTGHAEAYVRRGDKVEQVEIFLSDIYDKAARAFKVERSHINAAEY